MKRPFGQKHIPLIATTLVLAALYTAASLTYPDFSSLGVFISLFHDWAALGLIAIGMTFVILSGGIDLSVGAVMAFTTILMARLIELEGVNPVIAVGWGLVMGTGFGAFMGLLIQGFRMPPFLVTLGGMFFARGMAFVVYKSPIGMKNESFMNVADIAVPLGGESVPVTVVIFLVVFLGGLCLAHFTRWGRNVYALGGNEQSALLMGVPVARTKIGIYAFSGFCSALAGLVYMLYLPAGDPGGGVAWELDAIAAVVIGGTLLTGGVGYVGGTLVGLLIIGVIDQALKFQGNLSAWWLRIAMGLLLLVFILLQKFLSVRAGVRKGG